MLCFRIIVRFSQGIVRHKTKTPSSLYQHMFYEQLYTTSETSAKHEIPRLRLVDIKPSSPNRRYVFREVENVTSEAHKNWIVVLRFLAEKLLPPLSMPMYMSQPVQNMYAKQSLVPPESVRGMKTLDVNAFRKTVLVPGLRVPNKHTGLAAKKLRRILLKRPGIKPIAEVKENDPEHSTHKLLLIDPEMVKDVDQFLREQEDLLSSCEIEKNSVKLYEFQMEYKNWTHHEILRAILPPEHDGVAGFSSIGHILHLNLKNEIIDYKHVIGQVLLDKIPTARTVVNKLNVIDNTFRNFEMEVLAGDDDFVTVTKENGFSYKLDFSKVYWNPRLGTEHQHVISLLQSGDVVLDIFAGIGPFAVPAAKKGCTVYANDLNPHACYWLNENFTLNKVKGKYYTYNMDGRDFIKTIVKEKLVHHWSQASPTDKPVQYHIIMNLPAMALQFLDSFHGLLMDYTEEQRMKWPSYNEPQIYCYAFTKALDGERDVVLQAERHLGASLGSDHVVRFVRQVAPNKDMFCIMFKLTSDLMFDKLEQVVDDEPPAKKSKTELENC